MEGKAGLHNTDLPGCDCLFLQGFFVTGNILMGFVDGPINYCLPAAGHQRVQGFGENNEATYESRSVPSSVEGRFQKTPGLVLASLGGTTRRLTRRIFRPWLGVFKGLLRDR